MLLCRGADGGKDPKRKLPAHSATPAMQTAHRQLVDLRKTQNASFDIWIPLSRAFADAPAAVCCDQAMI